MAVCASNSERPAFAAGHRGRFREHPWAGIALAALLHVGAAVAALQGFGRTEAEPAPTVIDFVLPPAVARAADERSAAPPAVAAAGEPPTPEPLSAAAPEPKPVIAKPRSKPQHQASRPSRRPEQDSLPPTASETAAAMPQAPPAAIAATAAIAPTTASPAETKPPTSPYAAILRQWLMRFEEYPRSARLRRQEGTVTLAIMLDRSGRLLQLELAAPSEHAVLNQAALQMARRAAPYPPPPLQPGYEKAVFMVPFSYVLRDR